MFGHQSCNQAVITHSPHWQHFPDALFPCSHPKYEVQCCDDPLRSGLDETRAAWTGPANEEAQWGRLTNQRPVYTRPLWGPGWCIATVSRCRGLRPNKCGPPRGSIFNTHNIQTWRQSFIQQSSSCPRDVPLLVSRPNQRVGVLWRTND